MTEWYYRDPQSRKVGPLSTDEFEQLVSMGVVRPETRVWRSGLVEWTTYAALLAQEDAWVATASGPLASSAPESSSYSTLIALGTSAVSRRARGTGCASRTATETSALRDDCIRCAGCGEEWAEYLFQEVRGCRLCERCAREGADRRQRARRWGARRAGARWWGKWMVRCALLGAAFVFVRAVFLEVKSKMEVGSTRPVAESFSTDLSPSESAAPRVVDAMNR